MHIYRISKKYLVQTLIFDELAYLMSVDYNSVIVNRLVGETFLQNSRELVLNWSHDPIMEKNAITN